METITKNLNKELRTAKKLVDYVNNYANELAECYSAEKCVVYAMEFRMVDRVVYVDAKFAYIIYRPEQRAYVESDNNITVWMTESGKIIDSCIEYDRRTYNYSRWYQDNYIDNSCNALNLAKYNA